MDFFNGILEYKFLTNAFIACILSGIVCGIIGTYIVSRRLVFLSGGITHASFGGIGIAYYAGFDPVFGAMVFAVMSSLGIEWASVSGRIREDSAIGIFWSVGMALGIIFIYMTPGYAPNLMSFLFGSILAVTDKDIIYMSVLTVVLLLLFIFRMRSIVYVAFDPGFARTRGVPVRFISYLMSVLVAVAIVVSIRMVGIVLLISLLTLPAVIVNSLTRSYARIMVWASVTAIVANIAGLWISYKNNIPAGATAIFILTFTLIVVKLLTLYRSKKRIS